MAFDRKKYAKEYYEKHKTLKGKKKSKSLKITKSSGKKTSYFDFKKKSSVEKLYSIAKKLKANRNKMTKVQKKIAAKRLKKALIKIQNSIGRKNTYKNSKRNIKSSNILLEREELKKEGKTKM